MSKGWEPKSVEEQQAAAVEARAASNSVASSRRDDADRARRIHSLELQRERVLSERTSSPHRRSALSEALATLERDLEQLGWSVKL